MNLYSYCNVEGNTDVGCKRKGNEDWLGQFECSNGLVAVVCDGMGGHVGGEVASHLAVDTIRSFLSAKFFNDPREAIVAACNAANDAILQRTVEQPNLLGMGSTCVMLIVRDGKVYIGSVGDSRVYLVRSRTITQLTKDQSFVQLLVDLGEITIEQAEHHPRKNEITNALGLENMTPATVLEPINPEAGDCFLLCSDGLSGMVSDRDIMKIVSNQAQMNQRERVNALIQRARQNGGLDNITCQIVEFAVTPSEGEKTERHFSKSKLIFMILPLVMLLLFVVGFFIGKNLPTNEAVKEERRQSDTLLYNTQNNFIVFEREADSFSVIAWDGRSKSVSVGREITEECKDTLVSKLPNYVEFIQVGRSYGLRFRQVEMHDTPVESVSVTFAFNDSIFIYTFPVKLPKAGSASDNEMPTATDNSESPIDLTPKDAPAPVSGGGTTGGGAISSGFRGQKKDANTKEPDGNVAPGGEDAPPVETQETLAAQVAVAATGTTELTLVSDGESTDRVISIGGYGIDSKNTNGTWYSFKDNNGAKCTLVIDNAAVPATTSEAVISIKLANNRATFQLAIVKEQE